MSAEPSDMAITELGLPTYTQLRNRVAELEAALREIAAPTYGTEPHDTDAELAEHYAKLVRVFQGIARKAVPNWTKKKPPGGGS